MNIERVVLLDKGEKELVRQKFEDAREISQRVNKKIRSGDEDRMGKISNLGNRLASILNISSSIYISENFSKFSEHYQVIDILGSAYNFVDDDVEAYSDDIFRLRNLVKDLECFESMDEMMTVIKPLLQTANNTSEVYDLFNKCLNLGLSANAQNINDEEFEEYIGYPKLFLSDSCNNDTYWLADRFNWDEDSRHIFNNIHHFYDTLSEIFPITSLQRDRHHSQCVNTYNWLKSSGSSTLHRFMSIMKQCMDKIFEFMHADEGDVTYSVQQLTAICNSSLSESSAMLMSDVNLQRIYAMINAMQGTTQNYISSPSRNVFFEDPLHSCLWLVGEIQWFPMMPNIQNLQMYYNDRHTSFKSAFSIFANKLQAAKSFLDEKIVTSIVMHENYLQQNIGKLEIAVYIANGRNQKVMDEFNFKINELNSELLQLGKLVANEFEMVSTLLMVPLDLTVPLIDFSNVYNTTIGSEMYIHMNVSGVGFQNSDMEDNARETYALVLKLHYDVIKDAFDTLDSLLTSTTDEFINNLNDERLILQKYVQSVDMDEQFYM